MKHRSTTSRWRDQVALLLALALASAGVTAVFIGAPATPHPTTPLAAEAVAPSDHEPSAPAGRPSAAAPPLSAARVLASRGPFYGPPPMGWNGYNRFHLAVTDQLVRAEARALVASGMAAAGYRYVNLDGGWDLLARAANGSLQPNPAKFPQGIAALAAYVHSLGLKFGIYTSAGTANCAATSAGSYGHYRQDAATFAAWGVDYLKLDWCYIPYSQYPHQSHAMVSRRLAHQMAAALDATGRQIILDVNDWTTDEPWTWAWPSARMWRVTTDIHPHYWSVLHNFLADVSLSPYAPAGRYDDPDMLEVGNSGLTVTEWRTQFSLWAELAAPLIAGNDLTQMSPAAADILTNRAVIAVDQDRLDVQGYAVAESGGLWVLTKPLADGSRSVLLFNSTGAPATISTTLEQVGFETLGVYRLQDLWTGAVAFTSGVISAQVAPHGVVMYRVS